MFIHAFANIVVIVTFHIWIKYHELFPNELKAQLLYLTINETITARRVDFCEDCTDTYSYDDV